MLFTVLLRPVAKKQIDRLPRVIQRRILDALASLRENPLPHGCVKLQDEEGNFYRIRVGQYRIVYEVAHEVRIVTVIRAGHRKDMYRLFF